MILVLNAGSSSLKLALYAGDGATPLATGLIERIGADGFLRLRDGSGAPLPCPLTTTADVASHGAALQTALSALAGIAPGLHVTAVGHRVVHGGPNHSNPLRVDAATLAALAALAPLAPLHQPHNLAGIHAALAAFPSAPQIACFDTAFHRDQPFVAQTYALPRAYFDRGIRRYGFHGLSYHSIAGQLATLDPALALGRVIVAHLGNGASLCAMRAGRSVATTMGFSPLDGLPIGTRVGQIDPGVLLSLLQHDAMTPEALSDLLYRRSGLLGLSGLSNDMRRLEASEAPEAKQAIAYFVHRTRTEVAAMAAALGGVDALVFCGGIGENSQRIRALVCEGLGWMGLTLDPTRNASGGPVISPDAAIVRVLVLPTNEESVIAFAARAALG